jgi:hypothetical protein
MKHSKGAPVFTESQIREHATKAGVPLPPGLEEFVNRGQAAQKAVEAIIGTKLQPYQKAMLGMVPKSPMNKTEARFARLLDAEKRRGNLLIQDYKFHGLSLYWGLDEKTGRAMRYKPDFFVRVFSPTRLHRVLEIKGPWISERDKVRFRGCRAEWQWLFDFEMWQEDENRVWRRIE